jgi:hypothetical protein
MNRRALVAVLFSLLSAPLNAQTWYHKTLLRDLTGDGVPDTLELVAIGRQPDSLRITFTIKVAGQVVYKDTWNSDSYFQYDDPIDSIPRTRVDSVVRTELSDLMRAKEFQPLDRAAFAEPWKPKKSQGDVSDPREGIAFGLRREQYVREHNIQDDSLTVDQYREMIRTPIDVGEVRAIAQDILEHDRIAFTYFRGGEANQTIAWSPRRKRFFIIWGCC